MIQPVHLFDKAKEWFLTEANGEQWLRSICPETYIKGASDVLDEMRVFAKETFQNADKFPRFVLPAGGITVTDNLAYLKTPIRLPFPGVVLEYTRDPFEKYGGLSGDVLIICEEIEFEDAPGRLHLSTITFYRRKTLSWVLCPYIENIVVDDIGKQDSEVPVYEVGVFGAKDHEGAATRSAWCVLSLIQALQCSNVVTGIIPEPVQLNKSRQLKGKPPFPEYRILMLGMGTRSAGQGEARGAHMAPRQHLRRGHIRRLFDGRTIWVNQCVVGKQGPLRKDYVVSSCG